MLSWGAALRYPSAQVCPQNRGTAERGNVTTVQGERGAIAKHPGLRWDGHIPMETTVTNEHSLKPSTHNKDSIIGAVEDFITLSTATQTTEAFQLFSPEQLTTELHDFIGHSQIKFAKMEVDAKKDVPVFLSKGRGMDSNWDPALYSRWNSWQTPSESQIQTWQQWCPWIVKPLAWFYNLLRTIMLVRRARCFERPWNYRRKDKNLSIKGSWGHMHHQCTIFKPHVHCSKDWIFQSVCCSELGAVHNCHIAQVSNNFN